MGHADVLDNVTNVTEDIEQRPGQISICGVILACILFGIGVYFVYMWIILDRVFNTGAGTSSLDPPPTCVRPKPFIRTFTQPDPVTTQVEPADNPISKELKAKPKAKQPKPKELKLDLKAKQPKPKELKLDLKAKRPKPKELKPEPNTKQPKPKEPKMRPKALSNS